MNWFKGELEATSTAADCPVLRPARPALCQVEAILGQFFTAVFVRGFNEDHNSILKNDDVSNLPNRILRK